jgi:hypothetical protein
MRKQHSRNKRGAPPKAVLRLPDLDQFPLGHVSVQATERYLGCKQRIRNAVNDRIGIATWRNHYERE